MRVTLSRNCLKPKSSVGALIGASYQLLGADMDSLNRMGLYLKSKMVQSAHTGDVWNSTHASFRMRGGESDRLYLGSTLYIQLPYLIIRKPGHQPRTYQPPLP